MVPTFIYHFCALNSSDRLQVLISVRPPSPPIIDSSKTILVANRFPGMEESIKIAKIKVGREVVFRETDFALMS